MSYESVQIGDATLICADCMDVLPTLGKVDAVILLELSKYIVRVDGEILSIWSGSPQILKGGADKDGYRKFVLIDDQGKRCYMRRCVMVCTAFYGDRPDGMTVRHADGTRTNDAASNLSWATHSINCLDKLAHGTTQRGEKNGNSVISEETARRIKLMPHLPASQVAKQIGCKKYIVNNIRSGKSWGWL